MKTFIVRFFVGEDVTGVHGTVERPGDPPTPFHGARDLLARLGVRGRRRGATGEASESPGSAQPSKDTPTPERER